MDPEQIADLNDPVTVLHILLKRNLITLDHIPDWIFMNLLNERCETRFKAGVPGPFPKHVKDRRPERICKAMHPKLAENFKPLLERGAEFVDDRHFQWRFSLSWRTFHFLPRIDLQNGKQGLQLYSLNRDGARISNDFEPISKSTRNHLKPKINSWVGNFTMSLPSSIHAYIIELPDPSSIVRKEYDSAIVSVTFQILDITRQGDGWHLQAQPVKAHFKDRESEDAWEAPITTR